MNNLFEQPLDQPLLCRIGGMCQVQCAAATSFPIPHLTPAALTFVDFATFLVLTELLNDLSPSLCLADCLTAGCLSAALPFGLPFGCLSSIAAEVKKA